MTASGRKPSKRNAFLAPPIERLELPRGVRFPRNDEVPADQWGEVTAKVAAARLTTGYVATASDDARFSTYFEVNTHARHVWDLFVTLAKANLPDVSAACIGLKDDEPVFGPYAKTDRSLAVFNDYSDQLAHDGFLQFGVLLEADGRTEEILVSPAKYLKIWTSRPDVIRSVLHTHALEEAPDLRFIDEYPNVTEHLADDGPAAHDVFAAITSRFEELATP